jgi:DNA modification methylase
MKGYRMQERPEWGKLATFVPNKVLPIYNWFYYKEGFSRDLVMNLLGMFRPGRKEWVLDPFCGTGTTLLSCLESGVNSIGFDVHPAAVFSSRAKTREYDAGVLENELNRVLGAKYQRPRVSVRHPVIKKVFPPRLLEQVIFFRDHIMQTADRAAREFLILALMNVSMRCSYVWKDGAVLKIRKKPIPPVRGMLKRQARRMLGDLRGFERGDSRAVADFGDSRAIRLVDESVTGIITSPPYLNKIEYTKIYGIENELFLEKMSFREPVRTYIGLTLEKLEKNAGLLADALDYEVVNWLPQESCPYFVDMMQSIREMYRVCKPGARIGIVVGNGCFPDRVVESDILLSRIAETAGFEIERIIVLNKRWCTRKRTEKVGMARESLLLWKKP